MQVRQIDAAVVTLFDGDGEELASQPIGESSFAG
jgi:hypothetical protein